MHVDDIKVINILIKKECVSPIKANTINQLLPDLKYCYSKAHNTLKALCVGGFTNKGIKNCRAETYYVTEKGINEIGRLMKI